jgi:hypothetical protein
VLEGTVVTARRPRSVHRGQRAALFRIALGLLASRRFHEQVILVIIAVAALVRLARENQARNIARLGAWDRRQAMRRQRAARTRAG